MGVSIITANGAELKIKSPVFGPQKEEVSVEKEVLFNKEVFIAEYNSLRSEILQRITQQTTLYQIAITAFGLIIGYALEKMDSQGGTFNSIMVICVYPFLVMLLSYAWAFNQIRICQIAQYLREREKEVTKILGIIWWENYIVNEPSLIAGKGNGFPKHVKNKPGAMIMSGTQLASILLALVLFLTYIVTNGAINKSAIPTKEVARLGLASCFLIINFCIMLHTFHNIRKSGGA